MRRIFLAFFFLLFLSACDGGGSSEPLPYPEDSSESGSSADAVSSSEGGLISSSSEGESCSSSEELILSSSSVLSSSSSLLLNSSSSEEQKISYGQMIDERDGQIYRTVIIRNQIWMAENLNYAYLQPTEGQDSSSWCQRNNPENCKKYGRLYLWSAAMDSAALLSEKSKDCGNYAEKEEWTRCSFKENIRGVCPEGWHLPRSSDYVLFPVSFEPYCGEFKNDEPWTDDGTELMLLNILPAGYYTGNAFLNLGLSAWFWTVSEDTKEYAKCLMMTDFVSIESCPKNQGYSVRCIKDSDE